MTLDQSSKELAFALDAVTRATELAKKVQAEMNAEGITKEDLSPVTVADFAGQAVVSRLLMREFPGVALVGEESSADLKSETGGEALATVARYVNEIEADATEESVCEWIDHGTGEPTNRYWTLDPIDGTKGYLRGGQYAVALSLIEDGEVKLGVLGCPNLGPACSLDGAGSGVILAAVRGQGAWFRGFNDGANFAQLHVSPCDEVAKARMLRSLVSAHTNTDQIDTLVGSMGLAGEPVSLDSQAKYALLAAGEGELLFRLLSSKQPDYEEKIWDQAAGVIVVEEAGGTITDLSGKKLDFTQGRTLAKNRGICASNGILHEAALEALAKLS